jgi:hypothetical protein
MLSFKTHPQEIEQLKNQINSGKFYSITFIKKGGDLRYLNGQKRIYNPGEGVKQLSYSRPDRGLFTVWDNNAPDYKTGKRGAYRIVTLENVLYAKSGNYVKDYTEENQIQERFGYTDEKLDEIKKKMKIDSIIQEEMLNVISENTETYDINGLLELINRFLKGDAVKQWATHVLQTAQKQGFENIPAGDQAVIAAMKDITGVDLKSMGGGKYQLDFSAGAEYSPQVKIGDKSKIYQTGYTRQSDE